MKSYPDSVNSTFRLCNLRIYTIPTCGRNQKSSKSPPLNDNVPTVVETQFLYFFINLFWEISVNLFFFLSGNVRGCEPIFFPPIIRVSPTNTLTFIFA